MKVLNILTLALLLFSVSCSKDDSGDSTGGSAVNNNAQEDRNLAVSEVEKGISIKGGEVINEEIPTPNGQTSFEISNKEQSAFLNAGFNVEINVPSDYAGSYIQLQSSDGSETSSSYFDVKGNANNSFSLKKLNRSAKVILQDVSQENDNTREIEVRFDETIPPGTFCYIICVYDLDGNISEPQRVCVEIEAWGGNNNVVGNWKYSKSEESEDNGPVKTVLINQEDCEEPGALTVNCENGGEYERTIGFCEKITNIDVTINQDGTYTANSKSIDRRLDFEESRKQCKEITITEDYQFDSSGNWAYDEEENKLTLVEFESTTLIDGVEEIDEFEDEEDFDFVFDVEVISSTANSLILEERDVYTNPTFDIETQTTTIEEVTEVIKYFFVK